MKLLVIFGVAIYSHNNVTAPNCCMNSELWMVPAIVGRCANLCRKGVQLTKLISSYALIYGFVLLLTFLNEVLYLSKLMPSSQF